MKAKIKFDNGTEKVIRLDKKDRQWARLADQDEEVVKAYLQDQVELALACGVVEGVEGKVVGVEIVKA